MKNLKIAICLSISLLLFSSCSKILISMYGVKNSKHFTEKELIAWAKDYNIPQEDVFTLDSSYFSFLKNIDTLEVENHHSYVSDRSQPLQALYYDEKGDLVSYQINCYAGGFPNLKWNRNGNFETFTPKIQAPLDSTLTLKKHLAFFNKVSTSKIVSPDDYDYVVVVYWNRFMGRQSKRLIRYVQENAKLSKNKSVKIIYVNNDQIYADRNH
ncbi:hypothetical protein [Sphingobacterium hungaricum]